MSLLPYWLEDALGALPALAWMLAGVGLPWALAVLPRREWRSVPLVALLAIMAGPALTTAWMFVLGTLGGGSETALLTPINIAIGTAALALIGALLAAYKWRSAFALQPTPRTPLSLDERLLVIVIIAACVLRWLAAVWYPFWEYDPLWVYGYEGKLYTLLGYIPQNIGYYPQFLPLQYAYAQIVSGGVNDHAARAAFPIYHWGSILAVYALGRLNFSRRVGIYAAAIWAMYPHVGQWATVGDLEIPLTFACTGAAAFFLKAWNTTHLPTRSPSHAGRGGTFRGHTLPRPLWERRLGGEGGKYALIAGLFLAVALWTKPTGGALILGVVLLVAAEAVRVRFDWRALWPRFQVALVCGLATIPLGAVWYVRNVLLGHRAIDFPHPFWLTQAMRSGLEFGWPVLAGAVLSAWLLWGSGLRARPNARRLAIGWALVAAALLPSVLVPHRLGVDDWRILVADGRWLRLLVGVGEWMLLLAGLALLVSALWPMYARHATAQARRDIRVVGWALLLAAPYAVVWFYSYSYHYRLSFPIVPLLLLPVAVVLARWIPAQFSGTRLRPAIGLPLLAACMPALVAPLYHYEGGWDYLWSNEYPNDVRRLDSTNFALSRTVQTLQRDVAEQGIESPVIFAPGLQRLPFFFPLDDVRIADTPTDLDQLRGVDYYVYTQEARWLYEENQQPEVNPVTGSMYRPELMTNIGGASDPSFFSYILRVRDIDRRYREPNGLDAPAQPVEWPFAALAGTRLLSDPVLGSDRDTRIWFSFLASGPAPLEYTLYIHLIGPDGSLVTTWDSLPVDGPYAWYSTRLWESGEYVTHRQVLRLPEDLTLEPGLEYRLKIGWYDLFEEGQPRVPAGLRDGTQVDGIELPYRFRAAP
jgi:hypothetical protein